MTTTYRSIARPFALLPLGVIALAVAACGDKGASAAGADSTGAAPAVATAAGAVARDSASGDVGAPAAKGSLPGNRLGKIPVLEYHVIGGTKNSLYTRTVESFRKDLEDVYRRGYRPINMTQMLDKDFRDVPVGMSPVVLVFDDASPEQFSYVERNGKLEVDPNSAIGIILDFQKKHPDWKSRGVFCLLNGAGAGHNFFGDNPKWNGQKKEWRFQKVKWLADQGYELCSHTLWHARLDKFSDAVVQEQFARNLMGIDSAVSGYKVRSMALPYGIWPKNRPLAWAGSWKDPKTGQVHSYKFDAVMEVAGGPALSPYDPKFNGHSINRIQAVGDDIRKVLDRLDSTKTRFVWDGGK